jgi:hypothetical protein
MLGWTDLKAWMADCWKTSWKVEPLPFTVPDRLVLGDDDPLLVGDGGDEEHAARSRTEPTAATAAVVVICRLLRRRCIAVLLTDLFVF